MLSNSKQVGTMQLRCQNLSTVVSLLCYFPGEKKWKKTHFSNFLSTPFASFLFKENRFLTSHKQESNHLASILIRPKKQRLWLLKNLNGSSWATLSVSCHLVQEWVRLFKAQVLWQMHLSPQAALILPGPLALPLWVLLIDNWENKSLKDLQECKNIYIKILVIKYLSKYFYEVSFQLLAI